MENQAKETTVKDVLIDVNRILSGLNIPVTLVESIGIPVAKAINGIQLCIDTFTQAEMAEQNQQGQKQDTPAEEEIEEIELVELGDADEA